MQPRALTSRHFPETTTLKTTTHKLCERADLILLAMRRLRRRELEKKTWQRVSEFFYMNKRTMICCCLLSFTSSSGILAGETFFSCFFFSFFLQLKRWELGFHWLQQVGQEVDGAGHAWKQEVMTWLHKLEEDNKKK